MLIEVRMLRGSLPRSVMVPPFTGADSESFLVFTVPGRRGKALLGAP